MKTHHFLFLVLLLLCGVVLYAATLTEVPSQRGMVHPDYSTMLLGGEPTARHGQIVWLGWAFGALAIAFFVGLIDFALSRGGRSGNPKARRAVWLIGAGFELVFLLLILSYRSFMAEPLQEPVLGFPPPTAWMMYGIWGFPMLFTLLYMLRFDHWVLSPEQEREFIELETRLDAERLAARAAGEER